MCRYKCAVNYGNNYLLQTEGGGSAYFITVTNLWEVLILVTVTNGWRSAYFKECGGDDNKLIPKWFT